ncbi:secondary thiamine-phosphate synthase enzyme YjbQ [Sulfurimonas paralvinellae]|uniref:YjbQ family protein n=1 Tax=Sulfurimonas paralvinellae TaxID=317658 RepID=A0A7M1BAS3_9BACT|nr:secondary thiamine-phosphate synthase enzyme YjbQ [Sulfurimonas paralvinellae]QOP46765.1 YjbQ family protein [Sulfurimonas paralvinellae]
MQIYQTTIRLKPYRRGFHLITEHIEEALSLSNIQTGLLNLFIKHTSASLTINENCDPSVREDMKNFFSDIADNKSYYIHTYEGSDDMPAHIKTSLLGNSLTIPVTDGKLNLGTWQGIYLGEHRESAHAREIVVTVQGE